MNQFLDNLRDTLARLNASAFLDILIIATIIFALLMALRGTTAMTLLRGAVVIVCAIFLLSRVLDLTVVNFLVRNSLPGLVLGIVVIFQPEIRRALERAGRTGIRRWLVGAVPEGGLEEVASALIELAHRRHGAIVVLERSTGLEDYIESGVRLDAAVNARLLEGIFYPNSPLHDKAVIVRGDRIVAASCTLPLSMDESSGDLGTRHRAGLGVSERSDAVAVIVSEQTGDISVASEGRLIRLRDETRVLSTLDALLARQVPSPPAATQTA